MPEADAVYCAECMVHTNLWGIDSHGVLRAPIYIERVVNKAMNPAPDITISAVFRAGSARRR